MTPTTVSTTPGSTKRQRARTASASGIRPRTVRSTPVRIHLRIRLARDGPPSGGAPYLPTEPADWLHTTRFRRCGRSLIAASCIQGSVLRVLKRTLPRFPWGDLLHGARQENVASEAST